MVGCLACRCGKDHSPVSISFRQNCQDIIKIFDPYKLVWSHFCFPALNHTHGWPYISHYKASRSSETSGSKISVIAHTNCPDQIKNELKVNLDSQAQNKKSQQMFFSYCTGLFGIIQIRLVLVMVQAQLSQRVGPLKSQIVFNLLLPCQIWSNKGPEGKKAEKNSKISQHIYQSG